MRTLLLLLVFCLALLSAQAQETYQIKLTNSQTQKVRMLKIGDRVGYTRQGSKPKVGILTQISPSELTIDTVTVPIADIQHLGRVRKGSGAGSFVLIFAGTAALVDLATASKDDGPPCPNCTVTVEDEGGTAGNILQGALGVTFLTLGIRSFARNVPVTIRPDKWQMEIVPQ